MDGCIYVDDRVEKSYNLNSAIIPGAELDYAGKMGKYVIELVRA